MTSNVDELLSFSLRAAAISWSEPGLLSLSTVVLAKGWSHGEFLEKNTSPFPGQLGKKSVFLTRCVCCLLGCLGYVVLPAP